ncbi:MAG: hypothetical protein IT423_14405 [Pirellulaceae bacterium]|nr:hypothetical protein [Pirellulaceae bacterium]
MMKLRSLVLGGLIGSMATLAFAPAFAQAQAAAAPASSAKDATAKEPTLTAEQEKMAKAMLKQTLKSFADATLTAEQEKKADELFSKVTKEVVAKRAAVKIDADLQKKQAAAAKEAREAGKKQKDVAAAAFASAGFTEEQIKVFKDTQAMMNKAKQDFAKSLSEDQLAKLPKQMQKSLKGGK